LRDLRPSWSFVRMSDDGSAGNQTMVRRVDTAEWATYRRVRIVALTDAPYAFSSTLDRELGFGPELWRQRIEASAAFLAWRDGQPVGTAAGLADGGGVDHGVPGAWQLVAMWVSPQVRSLGVADQLVEAIAGAAREHGAAALVLWVTEVNGRARSFYRRLGFRGTGVRQLVRPEEPDHWEEQLIRHLGQPGSGPRRAAGSLG
jgi:GNAT superfamily N-acetyltransferase